MKKVFLNHSLLLMLTGVLMFFFMTEGHAKTSKNKSTLLDDISSGKTRFCNLKEKINPNDLISHYSACGTDKDTYCYFDLVEGSTWYFNWERDQKRNCAYLKSIRYITLKQEKISIDDPEKLRQEEQQAFEYPLSLEKERNSQQSNEDFLRGK
ncbi:hypothetical protein [Bdellovibrio sp. HCB-162]|uniref:hypothetical protein n=1 Tax=Bdellovibrio sp. HCB-162 TaxID=3394234 RepID=UPI0039BC2FA7